MHCSKSRKRKAALEEAAQQAAETGSETLDELVEQLAGYVTLAKSKAHEAKLLAKDATGRVSPYVHDAAGKARPMVNTAVGKVGDLYEDLKPKVQDWLEETAEKPAVVEANKRGHAVLAAAKGELRVPEVVVAPKRRHPVLKGLTLAAIIAAVVIVIRQLLAPKDDGWTPQEPSSAYIPRPEDAPEAAETAEVDEAVAEVVEVPTDDTEAGAAAQAETEEEGEELEQPAARASEDPFRYGDGSFIGEEPPEGFTIKGNERSMKYHTGESAGYDRTITDVWFNSEEAAQRAGFTRAQR